MSEKKKVQWIPAGEDGLPDESQAKEIEIEVNPDGSISLAPDQEPIHITGDVDSQTQQITYRHPEVDPTND